MAQTRRPRAQSVTVGLLAAGAAALALAAALAAAAWQRGTGAHVDASHRPQQVRSDGYASSAQCRSCHPSQYESWYGSFHRTMTQLATPRTVLADFDAGPVAAVQGRPMNVERRGDEFWAEFDEPDWDASLGARPRIRRQVAMITGAHHQQVYWYRTGRGRQLGQLPGTYLVDERRWIPRRMVFLRPPVQTPPSTTGSWNTLCINCHATHGKPSLNAAPDGTSDTSVADFGIACESCHGAGAQHVRENQNPLRRYQLHLSQALDPTVVQPTRLDPKASSQVCGQCHGVWMHANPGAERRADTNGLAYRPGGSVLDDRVLVRPSVDAGSPRIQQMLQSDPDALASVFWSDGMVRVSGREYNGLIDSPCYQQATTPERTMTCFSCHSMHKDQGTDRRDTRVWASSHQVSPGREGNGACLQCHQSIAAAESSHTRHRPGSSGASCYNCHMPYTSYGLLKGIRSHQISSPSVDVGVKTGRPNACNGCHLDRTLAWTAGYLESWYGISSQPLDEDQSSIAAGVLMATRGDAGQRALTAWAMGWAPAQAASGRSWLPAHLSGLLNDPYDAVRFIAYRSLRSVPEFETFGGDFLSPPARRQADAAAVLGTWRSRMAPRPEARLLIGPNGALDVAALQRLLALRDNRPVSLNE
jgi:hypothetical protein